MIDSATVDVLVSICCVSDVTVTCVVCDPTDRGMVRSMVCPVIKVNPGRFWVANPWAIIFNP